MRQSSNESFANNSNNKFFQPSSLKQMDKLKGKIKYYNNSFDIQSITIKMIGLTFCPWPTSHMITHIINHLVFLHDLQTVDDTLGLISWQGRMNNLITKDIIKG